LEQASCREERKYMEKENRRLKIDMLKNEEKRIKKLVLLAYENDPRIQRIKEENERERQMEKDRKN
jgi:DnaJ family protein C protein 2